MHPKVNHIIALFLVYDKAQHTIAQCPKFENPANQVELLGGVGQF
jgi:hypothetical protein